MSTQIKLKKSSVSGNAPGTGDLDYGELAINYADGKLYYKNSSNQIKNFIDSDAVASTLSSLSLNDLSDGFTNSTSIQLGTPSTTITQSQPWVTSLGIDAAKSVTSGLYITAVGKGAAQNVSSSNDVVAIGIQAGQSASTGVIAVGSNAASYASSYTIGIGMDAGKSSGSNSVYIGHQAGDRQQGQGNVSLGHQAGYLPILTNKSGNYNITLGYRAKTSSTTVSNEFTIGADSGDNGVITRVRIPGMGFDTDSGSAGQVLKSGGPGVLYWDTAAGTLDSAGVITLIADNETYSNANDLLSAILTIDGSSSGIDADKLDGQEGSHYLDYNNFTNTPTIPTNNNQLTNGAGYITSSALSGYATEAYVDSNITAAINNLVDGAPAALDTLNELAAAINDDSAFSSSVTTALGNRLRIDIDNQNLTSTQKTNATTNLGLATVASSGAYSDLSGTPTIPTFGNDYIDSAAASLIVDAAILATDFVDSADVAAIISATDFVDSADVAAIITGYNYLSNVVDDTTPQLGGDLDLNSKAFTGAASFEMGSTELLNISDYAAANITLLNSPNYPLYIQSSSGVKIQNLTYPGSDGTSGQVLTTDGSGNLSFATASGISNVVEDTTPQLGGDLDVNGNSITSSGSVVVQVGSAGSLHVQDSTYTNRFSVSESGQVTVNEEYTFPTSDGTSGQVLTTNGSGTLSFTTRLSNVVEDTTPQLGGNLDVSGNSIVSSSAGNITITPDTTGSIVLDGLNWPQVDGTNGQVLTTNGSGQLSFSTIATGTSDLVNDTTPQLGGNLDLNGRSISDSTITGSSTISISSVGGLVNLAGGLKIVPPSTADFGILIEDGNSNSVFSTYGAEIKIHNIKYPSSDGTSGQVLTTNGSGTLSFATPFSGVSISDQTSSSSTFYPAFTSSSSGSITAANVSTTKMYFQPSTGTLSATELNTLSDQTLKTDITPLSNSIDILNQVNPVSFRWKETGDKAYGVIAQEIEQVLPELVRANDEGIKSVAYSQLIALLVDTVKDQQKQIDELRNIINK